MLFRNVIAQHTIVDHLRTLSAQNRVPHASMLLGPPGCGTLPLAIAWASLLLCPHAQEGDPCGVCAHCTKTQKFIHPDLHFSFPSVGANATSDHHLPAWRRMLHENPYMDVNTWLQQIGAENKQGNITKEECLAIYHKLSLSSFESERRILVMWLPEYLGKEGNRLLKLIEEPPANTYFILIAENADLILSTILSRCQIIKVPPLRDADIITALNARFPNAADQTSAIAYLANGNFNEALELAQEKDSFESDALLDWIRKTYGRKTKDILRWTEAAAGWGREKQKHFLLYGLHFLRELLLIKLGSGMHARLQGPELEFARKFSAYLDEEKVEQLAGLWSDCIFAIERNANPKILFLDASIRMQHIFAGALNQRLQHNLVRLS